MKELKPGDITVCRSPYLSKPCRVRIHGDFYTNDILVWVLDQQVYYESPYSETIVLATGKLFGVSKAILDPIAEEASNYIFHPNHSNYLTP